MAVAFPDQAATFANEGVSFLPPNRDKPPDDEQVAHAQLTGSGVKLPSGECVVLKVDSLEQIQAIQPLVINLMGEWLAVAVRDMEEKQVIDILCELTHSPRWTKADVFALCVADAFPAPQLPYCDERKALARAILGGMSKRGADVPAFLKRLSMDARFVTSVQDCAGDPNNGDLFPFWLDASRSFASRARNGRLLRRLHPAIFDSRTLAIDAASVGNLDVLRALDSDGYDVRGKVGGGCCGGGKEPIDLARKAGHADCVKFLDELKLYPPVLRYDPKNDQEE